MAGHLPRRPDGHPDAVDPLQIPDGALHYHPGYARQLVPGGHAVPEGRGAPGAAVHVLVHGDDGRGRLFQDVV